MATKLYSSPIFDSLAKTGRLFALSEFVNAALFDGKYGYYRRAKKRAGTEGADFFTAETMPKKVFSNLIFCAAKSIVGEGDFKKFSFAEIGAEPDNAMFADSCIFRLGDELKLRENLVVVSNELLDAQPFDRFVFGDGNWLKTFLRFDVRGANTYAVEKFFLQPSAAECALLDKYFFASRRKGFILDFSFEALALFEKICAQAEGSILIFADYFRSVEELDILSEGSARAYRAHLCSADIFDFAGLQDITFSPCFEPLLTTAVEYGAKSAFCLPQEKFFMKYSLGEIKRILLFPDALDSRKRELSQLMSPQLMGGVFRILCADFRRS